MEMKVSDKLPGIKAKSRERFVTSKLTSWKYDSAFHTASVKVDHSRDIWGVVEGFGIAVTFTHVVWWVFRVRTTRVVPIAAKEINSCLVKELLETEYHYRKCVVECAILI